MPWFYRDFPRFILQKCTVILTFYRDFLTALVIAQGLRDNIAYVWRQQSSVRPIPLEICVTPPESPNGVSKRVFTFCVAFYIFVAYNRRHFKFGMQIDHSKSQPTHDKLSLKGAYGHSRAVPEISQGTKNLKWVTWRDYAHFRDDLSFVGCNLLCSTHTQYDCCKGRSNKYIEMALLGVLPPRNSLTDQHEIWHGWLCSGYHSTSQMACQSDKERDLHEWVKC